MSKNNPMVTYAVDGMLEFDARVVHAGVAFTIPFRGGSFSGYGRTPATFTTSDRLLQLVIEKSSLFERKRIRRTDRPATDR